MSNQTSLQSTEVAIKNTTTRQLSCAGLRMVPGMNYFAEHRVERAQEHSMFRKWIDIKWIVVGSGARRSMQPTIAGDTDEAKHQVSTMVDLTQLRELLATEQRPEVVREVHNRICELRREDAQ